MTQEAANHFAKEWINAWNAHDIDAIMEHYDESIRFSSPLIVEILGRPDGTINNKGELRAYFQKGLGAYPDLTFSLYNVLAGTNSLVIYYKSIRNLVAAELFVLNENGMTTTCICNYTEV